MKQLCTFGNYHDGALQICCHSISHLSIVSFLSLSWCLLLLSEDSMVRFFGRRPLFPRQLYNCFGSGPDATGCRGIIDVKKKRMKWGNMYAAIWSCAHPCTMKLWRCLCDVFQRQLKCHNTCSVKRLNDWAYYDSIRAFCMSQYYFTWYKCEIVVLNGCKIFKAIKVILYLCNNENTVYTCTVLCQS